MDKTLEFTTKSPRQIKQGDTETTFTFICKSSGSDVDLTQATNITAKIGNASGYLRSQPIDITSLAGLNPGWINFQPTPTLIADLPDGDYQLEIWVTDQAGTSIYPSDKPLSFTVTANIENSSGATITTIAFDDFVKELNKAASTIAKGDKGDDGLSAYQVAVINGYKGSQTDWLASLVGAKGDKGDKGDAGKDFQIVKTFPSIAKMDGAGFSDGDFTMIASDVNDPDDGKLYVWNGTNFTYIADLSGSQGIKGDKGDKGDTGDQGPSAYQVAVNAGFSGNVNQWLASLIGPKGDKGAKGDTGTVDNAGLISAPAFQSLQTQVNNSAVGTNLLKNMGNLSSTSTTTVWGALFDSSQVYDSRIKSLSGVSAMTFSFDVYIPSNAEVGSNVPIQLKGQNSQAPNTWINDYNTLLGVGDYIIKQNDLGKTIRVSFSVQKSPNYQSFDTALADTASIIIRQSSNTSGFIYSNIKLEKGSVATDWCPNPSEILTQSDYAKIKAAIVALGGALS
ncbi:DUF7013 family protein [Lactiplantibacillus plantarum]